MAPTLAVVVPTYRRPALLRGCLAALASQTRPADEVIVVMRDGDDASAEVARSHRFVRCVGVDRPGVLAALGAGLAAVTADVVAFTDDDAEPHHDWCERIVAGFGDPSVGAVGGRDVIAGWPDTHPERVGVITRWGKLVGDHESGRGPARDVDVLKGVNMAFRRDLVRLPTALRGAGAQPHYEISLSLGVAQRGYRVVYDPALVVDHHQGPRFDADQRKRPTPQAIADNSFNLVLAVVGGRPRLWWRRAAFGVLIGDRGAPGIGRALIAALRREPDVGRALLPSLRGQLAALRTTARHRSAVFDDPSPRRTGLLRRPIRSAPNMRR